MRIRLTLALMSILMLVGATAAVAQDSDVISYDNYGFSVAIPVPREQVSLPMGQINGMLQSYKSNGLVYVVFATDDIQPKGSTARAALSMMASMMSQAAAKAPALGLHTILGSSAQAVLAVGFAARVSEAQLNAQMKATQGSKSKKSAMDWSAAIPAELRQMFGNDIYQAALMIPLSETGRTVAGVAVVGPGNRSGELDAIVMRLMNTLSIGKNAAVSSTPGNGQSGESPASAAPATMKSLSTLKKGQIELIGTVSALDKPNKSLSMMVSQVTSFGQSPVGLNPARLKKVFATSIPGGIKEGSKIVVVAADSGVGKPVHAESVKAIDKGEGK
jgi:hypothetical protein